MHGIIFSRVLGYFRVFRYITHALVKCVVSFGIVYVRILIVLAELTDFDDVNLMMLINRYHCCMRYDRL